MHSISTGWVPELREARQPGIGNFMNQIANAHISVPFRKIGILASHVMMGVPTFNGVVHSLCTRPAPDSRSRMTPPLVSGRVKWAGHVRVGRSAQQKPAAS